MAAKVALAIWQAISTHSTSFPGWWKIWMVSVKAQLSFLMVKNASGCPCPLNHWTPAFQCSSFAINL